MSGISHVIVAVIPMQSHGMNIKSRIEVVIMSRFPNRELMNRKNAIKAMIDIANNATSAVESWRNLLANQ